ncbi:MAG: hypothetical protein WD226_13415 [Planctomycetota bacterium]
MKRVLIASVVVALIGAPGVALPQAPQPLVGHGAQVGLPSVAEAEALVAAVNASASLAGITPVSATEIATVILEQDVGPAADFVARYGALPDVTLILELDGTVTSSPFAHGRYADHAALISDLAYKAHRDALPVAVGVTLVQLDWTSATAGPFSTISLFHPARGVVYDSFLSNFVDEWPLPSAAGGDDGSLSVGLSDASLEESEFPPSYVESGKNLFGVTVYTIDVKVKVACDGSTVTYCSVDEGGGTAILWDMAVSSQATTVGNCCYVVASVGVTSGFRSVEVMTPGFGLSFSGSLGCKVHRKLNLRACCFGTVLENGDGSDPLERSPS